MNNETVIQRLYETFPDDIVHASELHGDVTIVVQKERIVDVARWLRDDDTLRYEYLENVCGVDYLGREPRFDVVYHVLSFKHKHRVCLKVGVPESDLVVPTLTVLWPTANWQEREAYDMFGITFRDHPALERILMPDDWIGHPLRKDVPLGSEKVAFSHNQDAIYAHKTFAKE